MNRLLRLLIKCHDGNVASLRSVKEYEALDVVNQEISKGRKADNMWFEVATGNPWTRSFEVVRIAGFDKD